MFSNLAAKHQFVPGWPGIFFNDCYLIRRILGKAIIEAAGELSPNTVLLDYGCGSKPYESYIKVARYIGTDVETSGHPDSEKRADLFFDGYKIPMDDGSVGAVLASEVFEHLFDLNAALDEIARLLKPGGVLIATCPFVWPLHEEPYDYARYTPYALRHELEAAGFEIVRIEKPGRDIETIAQALNSYAAAALVPRNSKVGNLLRVFYNTLFNSIGIFGRIFPSSGKFYLSNVVIARKA